MGAVGGTGIDRFRVGWCDSRRNARKIAVVAWAMMRDETDWEPAKIHRVWKEQADRIKVSQGPNLPPGVLRSRPRNCEPADELIET